MNDITMEKYEPTEKELEAIKDAIKAVMQGDFVQSRIILGNLSGEVLIILETKLQLLRWDVKGLLFEKFSNKQV